MALEKYRKKRDFKKTPEPEGKGSKTAKSKKSSGKKSDGKSGKGERWFVVQEHHASRLHFDLRLEIEGVLKSWAVPKGPSMDPAVKRLAVPTEDHPMEYKDFQGTIPEGSYGAGEHRQWDIGKYEITSGAPPEEEFENGKMQFVLKGKKLKGEFNLFRLGKTDQWLLVKGRDEFAEDDWRLELLIPDKDGNKFIEGGASKPRRRSKKSSNARDDGEVEKTSARIKKGEKLEPVEKFLKKKDLKGDARVEADGFALKLTSLDRVYWKKEDLTKADLLRYYAEVSDVILPYLKNRPLIMKRYPRGVEHDSFHQHDVDKVPEYVRTASLEAEDGGAHIVDYIVCDNLATHLYVTNLGAIERHPWHARVGRLETPDWFVFDLDPGDKVDFSTICDVAVLARDELKAVGLESFAKTSGSRGIHVYVPIEAEYEFDDVLELAKAIAGRVADAAPKIATVERSKSKRKKTQVYVDYLQNTYGKSVVAPYSVRPKPGATVSMPVEWSEIEKKKIATEDFTIDNAVKRLKKKGDIFRGVLSEKQSLKEALEKLKN